MTISVQIASQVAGIPSNALLRKWVRAGLADAVNGTSDDAARSHADASITLRIVNRAEAQRLNRDFRGKDYATNVLTFVYSAQPPEADVVLCTQVIAQEAREQGKPLAAHYAHMTVHGVLHALGWDHEKSRPAERMEAREIAILGTLGFANPYHATNHG